MWEVPHEIPMPRERQGLPPGGSPATDAAWVAWREEFLARAAERQVVRRWHEAIDAPPRLDSWRFDRTVFDALSAAPLFAGSDPMVPRVRLRFLGVWLRDRRKDVLRAAQRFVDEATA